MHAVNLETTSHSCHACNKTYAGQPRSQDVLDDDYSQGYPLDSVGTDTLYYCADPHGACEVYSGDITFHDEAWQCGACEEVYSTPSQAIECCQD